MVHVPKIPFGYMRGHKKMEARIERLRVQNAKFIFHNQRKESSKLRYFFFIQNGKG